jgi:hypothetical protein
MNDFLKLSQFREKISCVWIAIGITLGAGMAALLLLLGLLTRASGLTDLGPTPQITIVGEYDALRVTPTALEGPVTPTQDTSPTPPPLPQEKFQLGQLVAVFGTGGDSLRLRTQPGLASTIGFLIVEHEVFEVRGGPEEKDDYTWWYLVNPYDPSKSGWAVANYLRGIENP